MSFYGFFLKWHFVFKIRLRVYEICFLESVKPPLCIFGGAKNNIFELQVSMYLFRDLPMDHWHPTKADLEILTQWLKNTPVSAPESVLARYILSNLNWGM